MSRKLPKIFSGAQKWESPGWVAIAQRVFFFILISYVALKILMPSDGIDARLTQSFVSKSSSNVSEVESGNESTVTIKYLDGSSVEIESAALKVASAATLAKLSGDYSDLPTLPGIKLPGNLSNGIEYSIEEIYLVAEQGDTLTLSFEVNSKESLVKVTTSVIKNSGDWFWAGV